MGVWVGVWGEMCAYIHVHVHCTYTLYMYMYMYMCVPFGSRSPTMFKHSPSTLYVLYNYCKYNLHVYRVQCYEILQSDWSERGL